MRIGGILAGLIISMVAGTALGAMPSHDSDLAAMNLFVEKDLLIESGTRAAKPLSLSAENVTVITAKEIRDMNAHSVGDVLLRVPGLSVIFSGQDLGGLTHLSAQGSKEEHLTVLLDEMPWNFISGGSSEVSSIPVEIIDRIEVIKGPGSSAWGSSLGGVVNIITVKPSKSDTPTGMLSSSLGRNETTDSRAAVSQETGKLGYYLYAGYQHSDGLKNDRSFENPNFFAKTTYAFTPSSGLTASIGYAKPDYNSGHLKEAAIRSDVGQRIIFANLSLDFAIQDSLSAHVGAFTKNHTFSSNNDEDGQYGPDGSLFKNILLDEAQSGVNSRLVWRPGGHTLVVGFDYLKGDLRHTTDSGAYLQSLGAAARTVNKPDLDRLGLYLNDTMELGPWAITPGLRYDHHSEVGGFLSPSLGATFRVAPTTIFRASVARGFTSPSLGDTTGGGIFYDPNKDLEEEEVWSYQLGVETNVIDPLWLKTTLFRHDLDNALVMGVSTVNPANSMSVNDGAIKRTGAELEFETVRYQGFSLYGGFAYVFIRPENEGRNQDIHTLDLGLKYTGETLHANLHSHWVEWDMPDDGLKGEYAEPIWDLTFTKSLDVKSLRGLEVFGTGHNLFNGEQFDIIVYPNPKRWLELGVRLKF